MDERVKVLNEAISLITGARNNDYGPPTQDFQRTAGMLTSLGFSRGGEPIRSSDVARIMICLKLSRSMWSDKEDHWTDIAGYSGCGYECVAENER